MTIGYNKAKCINSILPTLITNVTRKTLFVKKERLQIYKSKVLIGFVSVLTATLRVRDLHLKSIIIFQLKKELSRIVSTYNINSYTLM